MENHQRVDAEEKKQEETMMPKNELWHTGLTNIKPSETESIKSFIPLAVCEYVKAISESLQIEQESILLISLAVLSAVLQSRYAILVKPEWWESLSHYVVAIGPDRSAVKRMLGLLTFPIDFEGFSDRLEGEASQGKGRSLFTECSSMDQLQSALLKQGRSVALIASAEFLLNNVSKAKPVQERKAFFLHACTGLSVADSLCSLDENDYIKPCLSAILYTVSDSFSIEINDDSLLQELISYLMYVMIDPLEGKAQISSSAIPNRAKVDYQAFVKLLVASDHGGVLRLDDNAMSALGVYERDIIMKQERYPAKAQGWIGKMMSMTLRLAGTLHVLKHLDEATEHPIGLESIHAAIKITELYWRHASLAFNISTKNQVEGDVSYLLDKLSENVGIAISRRDLFEKTKGKLKNTPRLAAALKQLEALQVIKLHSLRTRGGDSVEVHINRDELEKCISQRSQG